MQVRGPNTIYVEMIIILFIYLFNYWEPSAYYGAMQCAEQTDMSPTLKELTE